MSHTPLRTLITKHHRVLVVGGPGDKSRAAAKHYGFKEVLRPVDIIRSNPYICPHHRYTKQEIEQWGLPPEVSKVSVDGPERNEPIDSIMVFNDPRELFSDIQIIMDLLNSEYGLLGTKRLTKRSQPSIPIIFSNNDFYWANQFRLPRLGQGAVKIAINSLYEATNDGMPLQSLTLGKPYKVSYDYAHHILIDWREKLLTGNMESEACLPELNDPPLSSPFKNVYMVGDNPESDILGGNLYGWKTILVRTGVYKDGDFVVDPSLARPNFGIVDDVKDGVMKALKANGLV
ncbi:DEKNAAC103514 [Brettanomyces naardenensis]|uniref:DEKNAAC103514 n=1 Tax=Brettanomyces naardenensis TaxID=13370 RepID=A0A448YNG9_BRENA|nr:DEKNAAC103514 [Brettanomyces naardenensis]